MKAKVYLAIAATAVVMSAAAPAESYYVRNRPFKQVVKVGGEALIGAEAFLRALGMNWSEDGNVVTITDRPAANPPLSGGTLTFRYGASKVALEASPRGGNTFVSLRPLAKLLGYGVSANPGSGTVDVVKARFASDFEQSGGDTQAKDAIAATEKKAEEMKAETPAPAGETAAAPETKVKVKAKGTAEAGAEEETPASPEDEKTKKLEEELAAQKAANEKQAEETRKRLEKLEYVPPKEARLEIYTTQTNPDYGSGVVRIHCEVKNMGDAASKPVSGTLTLVGPDTKNQSATDARIDPKTGAPMLRTRVWLQKSVSHAPLAPGETWNIDEMYRHPSGNSMPIGNIDAQLKLNNTK